MDFNEIMQRNGTRVIRCGDFNIHNSLWGSEHTDSNGVMTEALMDLRRLVCLNDGKGTRIDLIRNKMSSIDLTLVSSQLASLSEWKVSTENRGSDHFPVLCEIEGEVYKQKDNNDYKWSLSKAKWDDFKEHCKKEAQLQQMNGNVDICANKVSSMIISAAAKYIPKKVISQNKKLVPWWSDEFSVSIKKRNQAFKNFKKNMNMKNMKKRL